LPDCITASSPNVRSQHGILILNNRHRLIRHIQKQYPQPDLHGHQIWQSSFMIMEYLKQHPLREREQVLDLGCGWGLLSVFCAKHFTADVTSIDADDKVFPYLDMHAQINNVNLVTQHRRFDEISEDQLLTSDVLMGGDICFWDGMVRELQTLITRALESGVRKVIIADPGRETFKRLADYCRLQFGSRVIPWELEGRRKHRGYLLVVDNPWLSPA